MLGRKLGRELWRLRLSLFAVAMVGAVGVANLVMARATLESLRESREEFYRRYRFADVFAEVERAPEALARRIADIDGIAAVDTRVIAAGRAELTGFGEPIRVVAVSLGDHDSANLNAVHLREGRLPAPGERRAAVLSDGFAQAHRLRVGSEVTLVLHGHRQRFTVLGIGTSPEHVAQMDPSSIFPDARRFAVAWLPRETLAAATDLDGAFNSVAITLQPGASEPAVLAALDRVLRRYGGRGAIGREYQRSHRYLSEEFRQLDTMARTFPVVFLAVSAFILQVVLGRLVASQREQIGILKAFGYGTWRIAAHYTGLALATGGLAALFGVAGGMLLGARMADLYREFYRLPWIDFHLSSGLLGIAVLVSLASAIAGAALPAISAARLAPAEAMRAEAPSSRWLRRAGRRKRLPLGQSHRFILRNLQRRPIRSALTWLGLASGTAIIMMGRFQNDAIDLMIDQQFRRTERHDIAVDAVQARGRAAQRELEHLTGVLQVEPVRVLPAKVSFRAADYRTAVRVLDDGAQLRRTLDSDGRPITAPLRGVLLTDYLARMIGARPGDEILIDPLDARSPPVGLPLVGTTNEPFGAQAYVNAETFDTVLDRSLQDAGWLLAVDRLRQPEVLQALDRRPYVAGIDQRGLAIRNFKDGMANTILTFTLIATGFGIVITLGVVYSAARVSLSEQARDLASLRILGFTRGEVSYLLVGELVLLALAAVPLGFAAGHGLAALLIAGFDSDLFRIPHYISLRTHAFAGAISLACALACGLALRRRVDRLDLVAVLKARE